MFLYLAGGNGKLSNFSVCLSNPSVSQAQFVDIPLADEDSSDEEYRPEDEDEDETAEDVRN